MIRDRAWYRTMVLASGLTMRWRGLASISRHAVDPDSESQRDVVREVLVELVAEGVAERQDGYAEGAWRLAR